MGFLLMMHLYSLPMLLLVVSWLTVTHFSRGFSKFDIHKLQCIQNSAATIVSNTSRYTGITYVLKKFYWLSVKHRSVLKQSPLFTGFFTLVFPSILLHISLPTAVLTVPGAVKVVVISLSFQSSNPLFINISNGYSFTFNALTEILFLMRFVHPPP